MKRQEPKWSEDQPIYRQIIAILIARLIEGVYAEGGELPSVREITDEFSVSHLTAAKVVQELNKEDIAVKRRGGKSEVRPGARAKILKREREQFLKSEWPELQKRLARLEIDVEDLFNGAKK